jgi:peptidylprolyl isomerase
MRLRVLPCLALCAVLAAGGAKAAKPPISDLTKIPIPSGPEPGPGDWRSVDPNNVLVIDTNKGRILVELQPLAAPASAERLRVLTRKGFYDGLSFFRVIDDFMDQTGDPANTGTGGSTLPNLAPEFFFRRGSDTPFTLVTSGDGKESGFVGSLPVTSQPIQLATFTADGKVQAHGDFCPGVGGIARAATPDSGNSQFFLMRGTGAALNENYTAFGRVIAGEDVVRSIKLGEPPSAPMDKMLKVRVLADLPAGSRPKVRVVDTASPWFVGAVARAQADRGTEFTICDVPLPSEVK